MTALPENNSRIIHVLVAFAILTITFPARAHAQTATPTPDPILVRTQIYRVNGDVAGQRTLSDRNASASSAEPDSDDFFDRAEMQLAGHKFKADENGWTWDGQLFPITMDKVPKAFESGSPRRGVMLLSQPSLLVLENQTASLFIGSQVPVEYFAPRPDGAYDRKINYRPVGLAVQFMMSHGPATRILINDFKTSISMVEERKPLKGSSLNAGEPVISQTDFQLSGLKLMQGRDYGLLFKSGGEGTILIRLHVDSPPPADYTAPVDRVVLTRALLEKVTLSMNKTEVHNLLGPPKSVTGAERSENWIAEDPKSTCELTLVFDSSGKMMSAVFQARDPKKK